MDIAALVEETRTLEIINPKDGEPLGITVELRSPHSDEVKAPTNKARTKAMRAGRGLSLKDQDKIGLEILIASVASWEWSEGLSFDGMDPDNSPEFKRHVLGSDKAVFIVRQINEAINDEAGFIKG